MSARLSGTSRGSLGGVWGILLVGLSACSAECGACDSKPQRAQAPLSQAPAAGGEGAEAAANKKAKVKTFVPDTPPYPKPGWSKVKLEDEVPLCAFADFAAHGRAAMIQDVEPQQLSAKVGLVFGVFPPWCMNEDCDDRPSLQCWADVEGNRIRVHSRYFGAHRDGGECREQCRSITAGCRTPALEAGQYEIQYGDRVFEVTLPGQLDDPCFGTGGRTDPPAPDDTQSQ